MAVGPQNLLAEGDLYGILGIALPVLMVGMAAGTIVINSATHLSNVRRASAKLQSWLTLSDRATENRAVARDVSARGVGAALNRSYGRLWLIFRVNLTRRRYLDDVETMRRRNRKAFIDEHLPALESQGTGKHRDVGSLFPGLWDGIGAIRDRGCRQALVVGAATPVLAFAIAKAQAPWVAARLAEYGTATVVLAMLLLVAVVYALGGILLRWCRTDRRTATGAFAWASLIPLYLGLTAIESSALGMPGNDRLYDWQTVNMVTICAVTMLVVRKVLYHRYCAIATAVDENRAKEYRIVGETIWFASDGGPLEARLRILISACYVFVVVHLLVPPIHDIVICGTTCGDLVTVTTVAAVTLMVPLVAAFMDGRAQIP
ncbi:hypothetical protein [Candidatus Palauibacter soopunensis]|uniref:hypothetical protein n=1 Tax=Candidatus Palauibacter soopunensis TaxID=3056739 RepID=UPI0023A1E1D8|nr:hypothetical protein [Candidatus Palauibacter soopunensis]MDE2877338.1 hypothetical protein [Candidatus Palauibacter soopunensis]